jgi:hypothetical protein
VTDLELLDARTSGRAGAVRRAHHRAELERFEVAASGRDGAVRRARQRAELGAASAGLSSAAAPNS